MVEPLLKMAGIGKRFPGVMALEDVGLEIYPSEIVALIGENGAGKSTLMKVLGGVVKQDSGAIQLDGQNIQINSPRDASERGIEFIHQELSVLDNLDVAANIFLGREPTWLGWLRLIDRKLLYRSAETLLEKLGFQISAKTQVDRLSLAEKQLVEIARVFATGARIVIMDEPTSSLTLTETRRLLEIIKDLKAQSVSIIYISHRLSEVEAIADRAVVLRDGRNVGTLAANEINHDRMVRAMIGRDLKEFFNAPRGSRRNNTGPGWFQVQNLRTLKYPQHAISFSVAAGEVLGLAGLVGAGRSELARAIFGIDRRLSGDISLSGNSLPLGSPGEAIKQGIYLIPEDRRASGLIVDFSLSENITLPALERYSTAGLISPKKEAVAAKQACERLNIKTPSIKTKAANLSGGNQQKVVLAKWLALSPKVLIFDEPTRGIDVGAKSEIYELIRKLTREGVSVIAISSEMDEVLGISDRIAVVHEGRITGILERDQFSEEAVMHLATGGLPESQTQTTA